MAGVHAQLVVLLTRARYFRELIGSADLQWARIETRLYVGESWDE